MADELLRERRGHVELLTINRPEARNAMNRAAAVALSEALDECETDDDVWVVVLTGAGDKAFSAGMDLKAFATGEFPITDKGFAGLTQRDFPKPLIAAVNGSALAGGFEMMISCDMVVAADHAHRARTALADGIEFVDEDDAGRLGLGLREQVAYAGCPDAHEHLHELRPAQAEEGDLGLAGHRAGEQRLARSRGAHEQHALGDTPTQLLELLGLTQELDDLLQFVLGFVHAGDVLERHLLL